MPVTKKHSSNCANIFATMAFFDNIFDKFCDNNP